MLYNAMNWYWQIGGDASQFYGSSPSAYVPAADVAYQAWLAAGNMPTIIPDQPDLFDVLIAQWAPNYLNAGIELTSATTPSLADTYPLDAGTQAQITGIATSLAAGRGLPGGQSSFTFNGHTFTAANFLNFATAMESYVYSVYQAVGQIVLTGSGNLPSTTVAIA
jgi:hypothetical protein